MVFVLARAGHHLPSSSFFLRSGFDSAPFCFFPPIHVPFPPVKFFRYFTPRFLFRAHIPSFFRDLPFSVRKTPVDNPFLLDLPMKTAFSAPGIFCSPLFDSQGRIPRFPIPVVLPTDSAPRDSTCSHDLLMTFNENECLFFPLPFFSGNPTKPTGYRLPSPVSVLCVDQVAAFPTSSPARAPQHSVPKTDWPTAFLTAISCFFIAHPHVFSPVVLLSPTTSSVPPPPLRPSKLIPSSSPPPPHDFRRTTLF